MKAVLFILKSLRALLYTALLCYAGYGLWSVDRGLDWNKSVMELTVSQLFLVLAVAFFITGAALTVSLFSALEYTITKAVKELKSKS